MNITKSDVEDFVKACRKKAIKTEQNKLHAYLKEFADNRPVYHNIVRTVEQYNNTMRRLSKSYEITTNFNHIAKTFWGVAYCSITLKNEEALAYMDITKDSVTYNTEAQYIQKLVNDIGSTCKEYDKLWENIKRKRPNNMVLYLQELGFDTSWITNKQQGKDIDKSKLFVCGAKNQMNNLASILQTDKQHLVQKVHLYEPDKIKYPCIVQEKYDGVFCIAHKSGDNIGIYSRTGKEYLSMEHLKPQLRSLMDSSGTDFIIFEAHYPKTDQSIISGIVEIQNINILFFALLCMTV